jgi:nucleoside-diphosphate-sugar epimerase
MQQVGSHVVFCHVQVSMNDMMEMIKAFDNKELPIRHIPGPEGVRGRNSDNALILEKLGWEPTIRLKDGLKITYEWIKSQLEQVRPPPLPAGRTWPISVL